MMEPVKVLTPQDVISHHHEYGETHLSCPVHITQGVHYLTNAAVIHNTCALLNSGGGVLVMENVDLNRSPLPKDFDVWWSGLESHIASALSRDDICNFVDLVGSFDDSHFFLFVKSAEQFCTIDYGCRLPTDTATHSVSFTSAINLCRQATAFRPLSVLPALPRQFVYGLMDPSLKQEGKQIQFKFLSSRGDNSSSKALASKVAYYCSKYITAFANHEGGHIFFGIEDNTASVMGEEVSEADEKETVRELELKMRSVIWSESKLQAKRGVHWDIQFLQLTNCPEEKRRRVIVVSVCKVSGGVFTKSPESYIVVRRSQRKTDSIRKLYFDEWKVELLRQSRDCPDLHGRFVKVNLMTPHSRLIFALPHTLQAAREKVLKLSTGFNLYPKRVLGSYSDPSLKKAIQHLLMTFAKEPHLSICLLSWGLDLGPQKSRPSNIKACLAIFSPLYGLHVVSLVDSEPNKEPAWNFTKEMAAVLKRTLVFHGGCNCYLGFKAHVLDFHSPIMLQCFQYAIEVEIYPSAYRIGQEEMDAILEALTIAYASYKPFGNSTDEQRDHYFLLTCDQLQLLWSHQFTKELWVHGPPGAGKTVAALQMVKELHRRGCKIEQVLYVAENALLCSYVRSFTLCMVVSRRELMEDRQNIADFQAKYQNIHNVIVDEAQNFKDRDGDWYGLLEELSIQGGRDANPLTSGYFWVFLDYAQKVHKFAAGLPGLIGKNNFMLSEISRNSKEIYEYASKFMTPSVQDAAKALPVIPYQPSLGHQYETGNQVKVVKCDKASIHDVLFNILQQFSDDDNSISDVAVLVSKKKEATFVKSLLREGRSELKMLPDPSQEPSGGSGQVLVSSVKEFSGLDRSKVIGLEPEADPEHADLDKLVLNLSTRARDQLVILTTSDALMDKLKVTS